jgi:hypothetical protein
MISQALTAKAQSAFGLAPSAPMAEPAVFLASPPLSVAFAPVGAREIPQARTASSANLGKSAVGEAAITARLAPLDPFSLPSLPVRHRHAARRGSVSVQAKALVSHVEKVCLV